MEEKQAGGFTNWLLGGGGWFTKSDEPLNDTQRKYEDVSRKTVKQCKIDALVAGSAYGDSARVTFGFRLHCCTC